MLLSTTLFATQYFHEMNYVLHTQVLTPCQAYQHKFTGLILNMIGRSMSCRRTRGARIVITAYIEPHAVYELYSIHGTNYVPVTPLNKKRHIITRN